MSGVSPRSSATRKMSSSELFRLGGDVCEMRALSEEDLVYRASRAQSLEDSVAALDQRAVILLRRAAAVLFICHIFIHSMFDADILR